MPSILPHLGADAGLGRHGMAPSADRQPAAELPSRIHVIGKILQGTSPFIIMLLHILTAIGVQRMEKSFYSVQFY